MNNLTTALENWHVVLIVLTVIALWAYFVVAILRLRKVNPVGDTWAHIYEGSTPTAEETGRTREIPDLDPVRVEAAQSESSILANRRYEFLSPHREEWEIVYEGPRDRHMIDNAVAVKEAMHEHRLRQRQ